MSETEKDSLDKAIDPPDNSGGTKSASNFESDGSETAPIDPPDNSGGTGG